MQHLSFVNSAIRYSLQQRGVIDSCYPLFEEERHKHGVWESHILSLLPARFQTP